MRTVTSLSHPLIKECVALRKQKRFREEKQELLVIGEDLVRELQENQAPKRVFFTKEALLPSSLPSVTEKIRIDEALLKKITALPSPEGIAAIFPMPAPSSLRGMTRVLVLDALFDPGNVGTLLRSALALGWEGVFFLRGTVDPFNDKVLRASKGALFRLPYQQGSWEDLDAYLSSEKWELLVADLQGEKFEELLPLTPRALLLSHEARGCSNEALKRGRRVTIPMRGEMESLNVSAAGAILLYGLGV